MIFLQISSEEINQNSLKWQTFKRGQIVGAGMASASVTKNAELFGVARNTASKIMTAFEKEGKTSSLKQNDRRKRKLSDRDLQTLTQFVRNRAKYGLTSTTTIFALSAESVKYNDCISAK